MGIVMYALMGLIVGIGIIVVRRYQLGTFFTERPVLAWPIAFGVGYIIHTTVMYLFEVALVALLGLFLR